MKSQELRFTETNSADDSEGKTWGLDGNLFWYVAGGSFVSVIILLLLFSAMHLSFLMASVVAAVPFTLMLGYVFGFRQGKPPGYDVDCFDLWLSGEGFGPEPGGQPSHPLESHHV
jgi:VIT1/CCC1 family predicted Fe2+/Mn2+ transporter